MPDTAEILLELSGLPGVSGIEGDVAERVRELLDPLVDETRIDVLGNVIGVKRCGAENAKKLMLDAHIDEIGLIVTGHQEGFLKVAAVGGLDSKLLPAAEVSVLTDPPLFGVICALPPHVLEKEDSEKPVKIEDMFIDIGIRQEEAEKTIPFGTPVVLKNKARRFGGNALCGKALDDRAGVVSIIRALELLKGETLGVDLYVMASVQEEVGTRGAGPGAFGVCPDWCVVVDVDFAKTPDVKSDEVRNELGGGVIVTRGPNMNTSFTDMAVSLARENGIKHQISVEPGGNSGTNARVIQVSREGVATALFGIPLKYMHSVNETVSLDDIESTARLMCEVAKRVRGDKQC